jgi:hypothetical protein
MFAGHQTQAIYFTHKPLKFNIIFHEGHAIVNTSDNPKVQPGSILQTIGDIDVSNGKVVPVPISKLFSVSLTQLALSRSSLTMRC